jgi:hypothetical protein
MASAEGLRVFSAFFTRHPVQRAMLLRSRPWRIALLLGLAAALVAHQARAADTSNGSRNFSTPASVPNYFSNESGPLQGPASETRRGPLYMNQTYGTPQAAGAVAAPRSRQHIAMAEPRGRYIRGRVAYNRRGRPIAAHHPVTHGRPIFHAVAHASARGHVERVAARGHTVRTVAHHPTQVSGAHHHARG